MKLKIFKKPVAYKGNNEYLQVGEYEGRAIYTAKSVPKEWAAQLGQSGNGSQCIALNDEVYGLLKGSPHFRKFLKTICEHEVGYGYGGHEHKGRSKAEKEVLEFLRKYISFEPQ